MVLTLAFSLGTTPLGGSPFSNCVTILTYFVTNAPTDSGLRSLNGNCNISVDQIIIVVIAPLPSSIPHTMHPSQTEHPTDSSSF